MKFPYRIGIIILFVALAGWSAFQLSKVQFAFSLEQFFPQHDPDLDFFMDFIEEFDKDDNFLLVGFENDPDIFDLEYLQKVKWFTDSASMLPHVVAVNSLTNFNLPVGGPFGLRLVPFLDLSAQETVEKAREDVQNDERIIPFFVSTDMKTAAVVIRTINNIDLQQSEELIAATTALIKKVGLPDDHILGRAYFQTEMVRMQKWEIIKASLLAGLIVVIVMLYLFRRFAGVAIAIVSIGIGMLLFIGYMTLSGRPFDAMVGLYPILMIIVGTSDVIHIMTRYVAEQNAGKSRKEAIRHTIKEIGLATFYTSLTTAIGFASLATSRIAPIRAFGLNASVGVLLAYITVIFFTTTLLSYFDGDQISAFKKGDRFWNKLLQRTNKFTLDKPGRIAWSVVPLLILCGIGISKVTTNYTLESNLPRHAKITNDYLFFEEHFAGFRPVEIAVFAQDGYEIHDYKVMSSLKRVEDKLKEIKDARAVISPTSLYKSASQTFNGNDHNAYVFPDNEERYNFYRSLVSQLPDKAGQVLISKDRKKARISSRFNDIGADSIKYLTDELDVWIAENTDPSIVQFKITGTAMILDKNVVYVRESLLKGLGLAVVIVSLLMVFLFRNLKIIIISLIPNVIPLIIAAAILGFAGIALEAGITIIFAIVFGIAVDDTIHFLSKYRISREKGLSIDEAIERTFLDTGKAICFTTIILFFGFMVMLFSVHPPSLSIGLLISVTLVAAVICDLFLIPVLIRWLMKSGTKSK